MTVQLTSTGSGPNLVLIHGWGIGSFVFNKIIPLLSQKLTVHCLDLPGYGINVDEQVDFANLDDIVSSIHGNLPKKFHVLGWSLGGTIAFKYALRYTDEVQSIISVCATPRFCEDLSEIDETEKYGHKWPGVSANFIRSFARNLNRDNKDEVCEKFFGMQAMGSPTIRQDIRELRKAMISNIKPSYEALAGGLRILEYTDLREECFHGITAPIFAMFGEHDSIVPDGVGAYWDNRKNTEVKIFKNAAHNPFLSASEEFANDVIDFCLAH